MLDKIAQKTPSGTPIGKAVSGIVVLVISLLLFIESITVSGWLSRNSALLGFIMIHALDFAILGFHELLKSKKEGNVCPKCRCPTLVPTSYECTNPECNAKVK